MEWLHTGLTYKITQETGVHVPCETYIMCLPNITFEPKP